MEYKDYYKILEVDKNAAKEEIKKQYRKLARKYHPDVNPGDKNAASKFAEINEAHEVLTDDDKRKKYDLLGADWKKAENSYYQESPFGKNQYATHTFYEQNMDDLFGSGGFSDFFKTFFGDSFSTMRSENRSFAQKGQDYTAEMEITLEEAFSGCTKIINVHNESLRINLKPGLKNGQTIKLKNKGGPGINNGKRGDLYLNIRIPIHPYYKRLDNDLFIDVPISIYKAILGGEEEINVLSGKFKIKIPPETENETTFRLKGKGFPVYTNPKQTGDLYVKILLKIPKNLSAKEKKLFRELSDLNK